MRRRVRLKRVQRSENPFSGLLFHAAYGIFADCGVPFMSFGVSAGDELLIGMTHG